MRISSQPHHIIYNRKARRAITSYPNEGFLFFPSFLVSGITDKYQSEHRNKNQITGRSCRTINHKIVKMMLLNSLHPTTLLVGKTVARMESTMNLFSTQLQPWLFFSKNQR